jgi:hypothetical protein
MSTVTLNDFLKKIAKDHSQYSFPINEIQKELTLMYLDPSDFNDGMMFAYRKLKRKYNEVLANVFLTTVEMVLNLKELDFKAMSIIEYREKMDYLIDTLTSVVITRIDKKSPDGQMLTTMAGG